MGLALTKSTLASWGSELSTLSTVTPLALLTWAVACSMLTNPRAVTARIALKCVRQIFVRLIFVFVINLLLFIPAGLLFRILDYAVVQWNCHEFQASLR